MKKIRFSLKQGPLMTRGRVQHFFGGAIAYAIGYFALGFLVGHPTVCGLLSAFIVAVLALTWEALTPVLAEIFDWHHPFGDWIDWAAYVIFPFGVIVMEVFK